jgi:class 3 adenylate cyclase
MAIQCPRCGAEAPEGMNFCGACGAPLRPPRTPTRERRLVSVLFCDLVGFTTFSETRDPEDVRDVLDEYFAAARRIAGEYGGTIEKFIGDAVRVWRALRIRTESGVLRLGAIERPLVGRGPQLEAVTGTMRRLLEPDTGVQIVEVIGEAGIGKSRLSLELERWAARDLAVRWHRGRSLAFGEGSGLSALTAIVRVALGISRSDGPQVAALQLAT